MSEQITVTFGNVESSISRYCPRCGFDRRAHGRKTLGFSLSFGESIVCQQCHNSQKIVKRRKE